MAAKENKATFGIDTPTLIGAGVAVFLVYNFGSSILESLGLKKDATDKANDAAASNENAWKPTFWQTAPAGSLLLTQAGATAYAKIIKNYPGVFSDDFASVLGVIKQLKTKSQVSYLASVFQTLYTKDLYQFLRNGNDATWFGQGLSAEHIKELNDYVSKLPNYKI